MEEKYMGSILGLAVNDALGMPTESKTRQEICAEFGLVRDYQQGYLLAGSYTDDTQQTIILGDSLLDNKCLEEINYGRSLRSRTDTQRGIGPSLIRFFTNQKGNSYPSNGLAMKITPVPLFYFDKPEEINPTIERLGRITHPHPGSVAGAIAIAQAIYYVLQEKDTSFDGKDFIDHIVEQVRPYDWRMAEMIESNQSIEELSSSVYASVPNAVLTFVNNPLNFESGAITLVNEGGDTDTKAAMFGAISGAFNGVEAIPTRWISGLENGKEGKDYLLNLAKRLYVDKPTKGFLKRFLSRG